MKSRWSDEDAQQAVDRWSGASLSNEDVALRAYTSRLIGAEPSLVLHGGGNTSVKTTLRDDLGDDVEALCVKGSGWDLGAIEPAGLVAVRLGGLKRLRALDALSDEAMVNAARTRLLDASSPNPSVETLLHAFLPHRFIDHSHADAILALANQPDAASVCASVFGERVGIVPYVMPGFALAKLAAEVYEANPAVEGLFLVHHGLFSFGDSARESYERHIELVTLAELRAAAHGRDVSPSKNRKTFDFAALAPALRGALGGGASGYVLHLRQSDAITAFVDDPNLESLCGRGPVTPDHVIRTKRLPCVLDPAQDPQWRAHVDARLAAYREAYHAYFVAQRDARAVERTELDPDPRVVLIRGVGLVGVGVDARAAAVAADLYEHSISVIRDAEAVGRYEALPPVDIFDMEYWSLEQAKLGKRVPKRLAGKVVIVTGAGSGIGAATVQAFGALGAHVVGFDLDPEREETVTASGGTFDAVDVRDADAVEAAVSRVVSRFGGLDGVVSNAGTAPQAAIDRCPPGVLEGSVAVNLLAHQWVAAACTRVMRAQGTGGFLCFNASKAAFNPGAGFGPYAIAKAGLVALMKQYAIEAADAGIRSNAVNADRVRTGLLDAGDVARRAAARGLDTDAYFRSNLLQAEVSPNDVAEAFVHLALAKSTTAAVITVDGGNIAASPR